MTETRRIVEQTWEFLAGESSAAGHTVRELVDFESPHGAVLLAIDADGTRHVYVPIPASENVEADHASRGVHLVRTVLTDRGKTRAFLDIRCVEPNLERVFSQVAASLLDAVLAEPSSSSRAARRVLGEWRGLLLHARQGITLRGLRGLFAELSELQTLLKIDPAALECWRGPHGAPQDFVSANAALEIKAVADTPARTVTINSLAQLDAHAAGASITLGVLSVVQEPGGTSLPELVQSVVASGAERDVLLDRLALLGVHSLATDLVTQSRFSVREQVYFAVREGFPCITSAELVAHGPAIASVQYTLDLAHVADFQIGVADVDVHRRKLVGR